MTVDERIKTVDERIKTVDERIERLLEHQERLQILTAGIVDSVRRLEKIALAHHSIDLEDIDARLTELEQRLEQRRRPK